MGKFREFKAVSLLRDALGSSDDNFKQETFNPRLELIEKSAYLEACELIDELEIVIENEANSSRAGVHPIREALAKIKEFKDKGE